MTALTKAWSGVTPKHLVIFLNTLILVVAEGLYGGLGGYDRLAASLGCCILAEIGFSYFVLGRFPRSLLSAYISGISLSLLLKPEYGLIWPYIVGAFLAIGSKYVLRYRGRHLWNPTNFALCLLYVIAAPVLTKLTHEFGNDFRANLVIWSVGLIIVNRAKMLHVTLAYSISFVAFAGLRAAVVPTNQFLTELAPLTGPMYQLLVFFMITDPMTVVRGRDGQIRVAVMIAAVECMIRFGADYNVALLTPLYMAPALFALTIVGPIALALDLKRNAAPTGRPAVPVRA